MSRASWFHSIISGERRDVSARLLRLGFGLGSIPYGLAVRVRNHLYDRKWKTIHCVGVPVISVGNLTLGGTGKTPCVEYVCRTLSDAGFRVAIVSRGYGVEAGPNDEALMLEECLPDVPHLQGRDRVTVAKLAIEELECEVIVLDDGFQHRRLHRELNIVLVDASRAIWGDRMFPRGTLRDPLSSLKRADVLIVTRWDQHVGTVDGWAKLQLRFSNLLQVKATHSPSELLDAEGNAHPFSTLENHPISIFSGIGHPAGFEATVRGILSDSSQLLTSQTRVYPDHHNYTRDDVAELRRWAETLPSETVILTTHKDLVKLQLLELSGRAVYAVRIRFAIVENESAFQERLLNVMNDEDDVEC